MEMNQPANRIHPLMAGAAVSVILASLAGIAAITGVLPNSHATATPTADAQTTPVTAQVPAVAPIAAPAQSVLNPAARDERATHKTVVHHPPVQHAQAQSSQQVSQAPAYPQPAPADVQLAPAHQQPAPAPTPAYQQPTPAPVAQNSPIGIGVGAVVGGLLGNQVGGGKGKTLATIAGAVGGGYLGNEIAKRNP